MFTQGPPCPPDAETLLVLRVNDQEAEVETGEPTPGVRAFVRERTEDRWRLVRPDGLWFVVGYDPR